MCKFGAHRTTPTAKRWDSRGDIFAVAKTGLVLVCVFYVSRLRFLEISRKILRYRAKITVLGTYRRKPVDLRARIHPNLKRVSYP